MFPFTYMNMGDIHLGSMAPFKPIANPLSQESIMTSAGHTTMMTLSEANAAAIEGQWTFKSLDANTMSLINPNVSPMVRNF